MANTKKKEQVGLLVDKLNSSSNIALVEFQATTHQKMEDLRKILYSLGGIVRVTKNSILEKSISKVAESKESFGNLLHKVTPIKNKTAVLIFSEEWNDALQAFKKFTATNADVTFKAGVLNDVAYNANDMQRIADLPPKQQLMGKLIGGMKSPSYGLVYGMKYNMQKMVYILSEKSKQN